MGLRRNNLEHPCITLATENKEGVAFPCKDYIHNVLTLATDGFDEADDTATVRVKISHSKTEPDWSADSSADNRWTFAELINQAVSSDTIAGITGVVLDSSSLPVLNYRINTNAQVFINVSITSYAGTTTTKTITALLSGYTND